MMSKASLMVLVVAVCLVIQAQARLPLDSPKHKQYGILEQHPQSFFLARELLSKYAKRENDFREKMAGKSSFSDDSLLKRAAPAGCATCCSAWWCRMVNEDACLCSH